MLALRHRLSVDLQTEDFLYVKIVIACRDVLDCQITCAAPPPTISGLINSIKASIAAYKYAYNARRALATYMTDRRYYSNSQTRSSRARTKKRCFVCEKENCWSSNHIEQERQQSKEQFKAKHGSKFNTRFKRKPFEGKPFKRSFN